MTEDFSYILENVISKAKYNTQTKKYQLKEEDYIELELSNKQIRILKNICHNRGIELEYNSLKLPKITNEKIFQEYNEIKNMLDINPNTKDNEQLEQIRIEIRNKILTDNLEIIRKILTYLLKNKSILPEINNKLDIEEIYQNGYEIVLRYMDISYLNKDTFTNNIISLLMLYIKTINTLNEESDEITSEDASYMSIKHISQKINISIESLEKILNIPYILLNSELSIEEEIDTINEQIELSDTSELDYSSLYDNTFEEEMYRRISQENILKIIDTISVDSYRQTLISLFGLDGQGPHNPNEIADILGYSKPNTTQVIEKSLERIKHPLRVKYLKQVIGDYSYDTITRKEIKDLLYSEIKDFKEIELFLLKQIEKEELLTIIDNLNPRFKFPLLIYLGYIDLIKDEFQTEIIHYKSTEKYRYGLEYALNFLREKIKELYVDNNKNEEIKNYLDYLMYNYLNKTRTKTRKLHQ